ncbi:sensor histidine kinase [Herbiconiux daphne]|uniref:histidine kinase n=1 Tax=Herbiconiux daphne TaxID=2970914 RepID=A0ABT2H0B5_9MICO|nr:histidine kinase [Herbiconiux daphne]MCS5732911.1 histidine kinase [Herbiconiux daphne]
MNTPTVRSWAPDLAAGLAVLVLGLWEAYANAHAGYDYGLGPWLVVFGTAAAVSLVRRNGWWSLGILWAVLVLQVATATDLMLIQLAVVGIAFGLARWGSKPLLWASGASIPFATVLGLGYIGLLANGIWGTRVARNLIVPLVDSGIPWPLVVLPMIAGLLALPWFAGLAARYWGAARMSQRSQAEAEAEALAAQHERARMTEIATLREGQARLARDVHDVVGHSLTVILAQAESAQFLDGDDPEALKRTMTTIAESARSSLQEVRAVLTSPDGGHGQRTDLDTLIDATRASGYEITVADAGSPRPLPPELATVAFRVLQEMLTNAIKHGRRDGTVAVERDWGDERLRLSVANEAAEGDGDGAGAVAVVADAVSGADATNGPAVTAEGARADDSSRPPAGSAPAHGTSTSTSTGNGIGGMRRRLESVGGSLELRQSYGTGSVFTAIASLPVRAPRPLEVAQS